MHPRGVGPNAGRLSEGDLSHNMQVITPHIGQSFDDNGYVVIPNVLSSLETDDERRSRTRLQDQHICESVLRITTLAHEPISRAECQRNCRQSQQIARGRVPHIENDELARHRQQRY